MAQVRDDCFGSYISKAGRESIARSREIYIRTHIPGHTFWDLGVTTCALLALIDASLDHLLSSLLES